MPRPHITSLPQEILYLISDELLPPGQNALSRTCQQLYALLTPILWSEIEFHHRGCHEGLDLGLVGRDRLPDIESQFERAARYPAKHGTGNTVTSQHGTTRGRYVYPYEHLVAEPSARKYFQPWSWKDWVSSPPRESSPTGNDKVQRASDNINRDHLQRGREEMFIQAKSSTSTERWETLSQHIRSLCFSTGIDDEVVEVLSSLSNLTSLEVVGLPLESRARSPWYPDGQPPARAPFEVKFPHLKNLKLRGYFPAAFVRSVCSNSPNITHVDLGLLASMRDDKPFKEGLLRWESRYSVGPRYDTDSEDEEMIPWALHSPLWLYPEVLGPLILPKLTHLSITRPFRSHGYDWGSDGFEQIPEEFERAQVREWAAFLRTNAGTLTELIFDYRLPQEDIGTVGDGDPEPEIVDRAPVPGYITFSHLILELLLKDSNLFPNMRHLVFRGMRLTRISTDQGRSDDEEQSNNHEENIQALLQRTFPDCDIETYQDPYPLYAYGGQVYQGWPASRHEAMQDAADGLLFDSSYYNDYVRRFGRHWKVTE